MRTGPDRLSLFLGGMRRNWRLAVCLITICVALSVAMAFLLPSYWRVEATVIPVPRGPSGGFNLGSLAGLASGLGGVGAIIGRPASSQDEAVAVLNSRELFDVYATRENILPILFDDEWDSVNKRWLVRGSDIPTLRRGYRLFERSIRDVELDRRTGIVTLSITWKDRALAMKWARDLVDLTNAQLREHAMAEAEQNLRYLDAEMRRAGSDNGSNQLAAAISGAYERALQDYMFAKGQPDYAFRIIDPPTYPDDRERVWPRRVVFAVLGFLTGAVLAVALVQIQEWLRGRRTRDVALADSAVAQTLRAA